MYSEWLCNVSWYDYTTIYLFFFLGFHSTCGVIKFFEHKFLCPFLNRFIYVTFLSNCMNSFRAHNTHYYIVLRTCSTTINSCMRSLYWTLPSTEYFQCKIFANFVGENFFAASDKFFPHILSLVIYCCSFTIFQSASVFFLINLQSSLHFDGISYGKSFPLCDDCKNFVI